MISKKDNTKSNREDTDTALEVGDVAFQMKEIVESASINFLIGAGASTPFLPLLNSIEMRLSGEKDENKKIAIYKEYCKEVMLPNIDVLSGEIPPSNEDYKIVSERYLRFFKTIGNLLLKRKSTILSKQANIFTTNIDILMETVLEKSGFEYSDGFSGKLEPVFSLSNYKRSILKRSLHFENVSEIPVFNLIKIHGSLTWKRVNQTIHYSKLATLSKELIALPDSKFIDAYGRIAIVNPEPKKVMETVIDVTYYELLRMYSSELEKENSVLFVVGFSFSDAHIHEITMRAANSNPTLKVYVFCHSKDKLEEMRKMFPSEKMRFSNVEVISPRSDDEGDKLNLGAVTERFFSNIVPTRHDS